MLVKVNIILVSKLTCSSANPFESVYVEGEISIFGFNAFILKRGRLGSII